MIGDLIVVRGRIQTDGRPAVRWRMRYGAPYVQALERVELAVGTQAIALELGEATVLAGDEVTDDGDQPANRVLVIPDCATVSVFGEVVAIHQGSAGYRDAAAERPARLRVVAIAAGVDAEVRIAEVQARHVGLQRRVPAAQLSLGTLVAILVSVVAGLLGLIAL